MADMMAGGKGVSPRKAMAMGDSGSFGCGSIHGTSKAHPERDSGVQRKTLGDDIRAAGKPVHHSRGKPPAQANPDHGPHKGAHGPEFGAGNFPK